MNGKRVLVVEDALMAAPFDLATMKLSGHPVALDERVLDDEGAQFSVSDAGTFIYRAGVVAHGRVTCSIAMVIE